MPSGLAKPLARLAETKRRMDAIKGSREAVLTPALTASSNHTRGTCIFTYAGTVRVGFKLDAVAIPDPGLLLAGFVAELAALHPGGSAAVPDVAVAPAPPLMRV